MQCYDSLTSRRRFLRCMGGLGLTALFGSARTAVAAPLLRPIPSSGERLPAIGLGTWITFDVGNDRFARDLRVEILHAFFARGGALIDSSPMYGSAEEVIGHCLQRLNHPAELFSATKVWTPGRWLGMQQMETSRGLWGVERIDLMQVHNLLDWQTHLATLQDWKAAGRLRYIGVTTSHGRRHAELERIMTREPLDFVQFTYNIHDRQAEQRLLPLAAERGIAVLVNRPFRRGALFRQVRGKPLPDWAVEIDCTYWAQFLLKFIVSHPAVTCAIPATSRVEHMQQNLGALYGRLPDAGLRRRMVMYFEAL